MTGRWGSGMIPVELRRKEKRAGNDVWFPGDGDASSQDPQNLPSLVGQALL